MTKNRLIKYIATLVCALLTLSLFSCVAQPIDGSGEGSSEATQDTRQEITSNGNLDGGDTALEGDGEDNTDSGRDDENRSDSESGSETETETETETEPNYGMGFIPL